MRENVSTDSLEVSASTKEDILSFDSFMRCVLPRGERAQAQAPALVPAMDDEDVQAKVFAPAMLDAQFPRQHLVQFLPTTSAPLSGAASSSADRRLPAEPRVLPSRVAHVRDERGE